MTEPEPTQPVIPRKIWYALVATFVSSLLITVMAVIVSGIAQNRLERRIDEQRLREDIQWCKLLIPLDERNSARPVPKNEDDKIVADVVHGLRGAYRCDDPSRRAAVTVPPPTSPSPTVVRSPQSSTSQKDR